MSEIIRKNPYVTPDSMRQKLHMDEQFFDLHTKNVYNREDINGSPYVGNIQNWGAEMLLETRKMKLDHPPLGDIILNDSFHEYFELDYDDNLNTYMQENAIMCLLKKDALHSLETDDETEWRIVFKNVEPYVIPRADVSSNPLTMKHVVWKTNEPPVLVHKTAISDEEIPLVASHRNGGDVTYWFHDTSPSHTWSDPLKEYYNPDVMENVIDAYQDIPYYIIPMDNDKMEHYFDYVKKDYEEMFIDLEESVDNKLVTIPLKRFMEGLPFIWMTFSELRTLPDPQFKGNVDKDGHPLLIPGTNGHNQHFLYALAFGFNNHPEITVKRDDSDVYNPQTMPMGSGLGVKWQVRVYAVNNQFTDDPDKFDENANIEIEKIQFIEYWNNCPWDKRYVGKVTTITWDRNKVHVKFITKYDQFYNKPEYYYYAFKYKDDIKYAKEHEIHYEHIWKFKHPLASNPENENNASDWDFDGVSYKNDVVYGYIDDYMQIFYTDGNYERYSEDLNGYIPPHLFVFHGLIPLSSYAWTKARGSSEPMFRLIPEPVANVSFDDVMTDRKFGIHVDYTSDYSLNNVEKKNGTIFNLGDFDGLPWYYHTKLPRDTHRSHVELYGVRDTIKSTNHQAMNKRVATVIVDAGIPLNELQEIVDDSESAIHYFKTNDEYGYDTNKNQVVSLSNVNSDILFSSRSEFIDQSINNKSLKNFIYHGKRYFSTSALEFNGDNIGRVYYLSNDSIAYSNNALLEVKKPERTMARICDIPTKIEELISIKQKAPQLLIDEKYVRQEAPYTIEDQSKVLQSMNNGIWLHGFYGRIQNSNQIFSYMIINDDNISIRYKYGVTNLNRKLNISKLIMTNSYIETHRWSIQDGGKGYRVGDMIQCYVAGHVFKSTVTEVIEPSGEVQTLGWLEAGFYEPYSIAIENFDSRITVANTTLIKAMPNSRGRGLQVKLTIYSLDDDNIDDSSLSDLSDDLLRQYEQSALQLYSREWQMKNPKRANESDEDYSRRMMAGYTDSVKNRYMLMVAYTWKGFQRVNDSGILPNSFILKREGSNGDIYIHEWLNGLSPSEEIAFKETHPLLTDTDLAKPGWYPVYQLTGDEKFYNPYDVSIYPRERRSFRDVYIKKLFTNENAKFGEGDIGQFDGVVFYYDKAIYSVDQHSVSYDATAVDDEDYSEIVNSEEYTSLLPTLESMMSTLNLYDLVQSDTMYILRERSIEKTITKRETYYDPVWFKNPDGSYVLDDDGNKVQSQGPDGPEWDTDNPRYRYTDSTSITNQKYIDSYEMGPKFENSIVYPAYNKANFKLGFNKAVTIGINGLLNGWSLNHGYIPKQPDVFMYNPFKKTYRSYEQFSEDVLLITDENDITFYNLTTDLYSENGANLILNYDVFKYNGYNIISREDDECVYHPNILDADDTITLLRKSGEVFATRDVVTGKITAVGDNPEGASLPLSSNTYYTKYKMNGYNVTSSPINFFTIPDNADITPPFAGFHMKDEYSYKDISKNTVLIYKRRLYVFNESLDSWDLLVRRN